MIDYKTSEYMDGIQLAPGYSGRALVEFRVHIDHGKMQTVTYRPEGAPTWTRLKCPETQLPERILRRVALLAARDRVQARQNEREEWVALRVEYTPETHNENDYDDEE